MDGLMDCSFSRRSSFLLLLLLLLLFLYIGLLFVVGAVGAGFVVHDGTAGGMGGMGGFCGGCGGGGGVTIHGKLVSLFSDGDDDAMDGLMDCSFSRRSSLLLLLLLFLYIGLSFVVGAVGAGFV